jgi:two-component system, NarL family, sensor histidine kinase DesK
MNAGEPVSSGDRLCFRVEQAAARLPQSSKLRPPRRNPAFDYIWLIYSAFFFADPVQRHSTRVWIVFGVAYALFLLTFSGIIYARTLRRVRWLLAALAVLGLAYTPFNYSFLGVFIYLAALAPFAFESLPISFACIFASALAAVGEGIYGHLSPWSSGTIAFIAIGVGAGNVVLGLQRRSAEKLLRAHQEMAQLAKLAERERIARDLHDLLGHTLSVVVLKSELAGRLFDNDPARARAEIGEVESISRQALQQVREAVSGFRMQGLQAEIDSAQKSLAAAGVTLTCVNPPPKLGAAAESVLALILREAATNVLRHARATECWLDFSSGPEGADLVVTDNGRGGIREEGNGLRGMRERVQMLGGSFRLESVQGTRLFIHLPGNA